MQNQLRRVLGRAALYAPTPFAAFDGAVRRELSWLKKEALSQLSAPVTRVARVGDEASARAELCLGFLTGDSAEFPREALMALAECLPPSEAELHGSLEHWLSRHDALKRRLRWLVDPELTRSLLGELDPLLDADQLWCFVKYDFRQLILHAGWANAIKRVSQNEAMATFIHATGAAEANPVKRTEDTLYFLYYRFNWGKDSSQGSRAVGAINQIHGRYTIPHEAMKFVLLDSVFSVLDAIDALGHRPLTPVERLGCFNATLNLGREMNISDLSHDYDEMARWFRNRCNQYSTFAPQKRRLWLSISDSFDSALKLSPQTAQLRRALEIVAMDDGYRNALGFARPSKSKVWAAKGLMKVLAGVRRLLPAEAYVESLQPCFSYPDGASVEELGEKSRAARMPRVCPFSGAPMNSIQRGSSDRKNRADILERAACPTLATVTWEQIAPHNKTNDLWLVFDGHVYDVSAFAANHPGGLAVLLAGHGRDLTAEYDRARHSPMARGFAENFRIAKLADPP